MVYDIKSVLIVEAVGKKCMEILTKHGIKVTQKSALTEKELINIIPEYDVIIVQTATRITIDVLLAAKKLKVVASGGAYFKNIDVFAAINRKITVLNAPRGCTLSACEYTCTLMLALARHLVTAIYTYRTGVRDRAMYTGSELHGSTLALIGLSEVAQGVAVRMKSFGMRVIGFDQSYTSAECRRFGVIKIGYSQLWPQADYIVIYTSPFDTNIPVYITAEILRQCKRGVKIIVMGHIGVFLPRDMFEGLRSGQVGGAAFDLYEEYIDIDFLKYAIFQHPAVICTSLLGTDTVETIERGGQEIAEQIVNLCKPNTYETPISKVIAYEENQASNNVATRFF